MLNVHQIYKTFGGWEALVIWRSFAQEGEEVTYLVIHNPGIPEESGVVFHDAQGCATAIFSINEPPTYGTHHPADLIIED